MDPRVVASGAAVVVASAALVAGLSGDGSDAPEARRADIDSELVAPGELATSEVVLPRGWRVVGDVDYTTDGWDTLAVEHEDREDGTRVLIRARNMSGETRRVKAWIRFADGGAR